MPINLEIKSEGAVITLIGGIDYSMQEAFKDVNDRALAAPEAKTIQVDFAKATFLDSAGIRALIMLKKGADQLGKSLALLNCNDAITKIFEIGGFDTMFTFG